MTAREGKAHLPDEFSLIEKLFAPLAGPGGLGLKDDAGVIEPSPGFDLVVTKDAIAEGRHYLPDDPPDDVARKLLRVNLSDLAAKGATPKGYLLACVWSSSLSFEWMKAFAQGLYEDQNVFDVGLLGGDTIRVDGSSVFSLTAFGEVPSNKMVRRVGANPGDDLYVTGTIGDAALGLKVALGELEGMREADEAFLVQKYRVPNPPVTFGTRLGDVASAALDVSDGLVADLRHLCEVSSVGAVIHQEMLPLSDVVAGICKAQPDAWQSVLAGGDDYQILFSAPPDAAQRVEALGVETGTSVTRIGKICEGQSVSVQNVYGVLLDLPNGGFSHF